jgi:hypothetical protein
MADILSDPASYLCGVCSHNGVYTPAVCFVLCVTSWSQIAMPYCKSCKTISFLKRDREITYEEYIAYQVMIS